MPLCFTKEITLYVLVGKSTVEIMFTYLTPSWNHALILLVDAFLDI